MAYYPESNGRAEVAVKSAKRLLRSNIHASGSLNGDKFLKAMLQLRNTPDPDCSLSPAEIVYGHPLRDSFAFADRIHKNSDRSFRKTWTNAWSVKEEALRVRFAKATERLNEHSRDLLPLKVGDPCLIQNQTGNHPKRWDRSGMVTEVLPFDKYTVKIDGSWRVTQRNRRFLKASVPASTEIYHHRAPVPESTIPIPNKEVMIRSPRQEVPAASYSDNVIPYSPPTTSEKLPNHSPVQQEPKRLPLMLRRLQDHNKPGLKESPVPCDR